MKRLFLILVAGTLLQFSCREKDRITLHTVTGQVYNNCTDSGLAGTTVTLKTYKDKSLVKNEQTVTGSDGGFVFSNVEIHSLNSYHYFAYIPGKSGDGGPGPEYASFSGASMEFSKDEADRFLQLRVTPGFYRIFSVFTNTGGGTDQDSVKLKYEQRRFHQNVPDMPYYYYTGSSGNIANDNSAMGNYPMGLYHIIKVTKRNGVITTSSDSLYIGSAGTVTYSVIW